MSVVVARAGVLAKIGGRSRRRVAGLLAALLISTGLVATAGVAPAAAAPVGVPYGGPGGEVRAWGYNVDGQSTVPAGLTGVTAVAAGTFHSLALKSDGTVAAWGYAGYGATSVPTGLSGVTAVSAGIYDSLALKSDGTVVAWGTDTYGQASVPAGLSGVTAIAAGKFHSLALKSDGTVVGWGDNNYGEATAPAGLTGVTAIAAGDQHSLALKSDGTVVAWGGNSSGQASVPAGLSGVTAIAAGAYHSLALKSDGTVVAWGNDYQGQSTVPAGLSGVTAVAAGDFHSLALKSDGTVAAWGYDGYGEVTVPAGLSGVTAISAGYAHNLAVVALVAFTAASPPDAVYGSAYSYQYAATLSGSPVGQYSLAGGQLPPGVSLNPGTGLLSGTPTAAGQYTFTIRATSGTGPAASYADSPSTTLTVAPRPVTITANSQSSTYGQPDPAFTYQTIGLLPGDALTSTPTCTVAVAHTAAGSYPITCTGASAGPNYSVTYLPGTLTVGAKVLTVAAAAKTIGYGDADPAFTYTVTGLNPGDSLTTTPTCGVSGAHTNVGAYDITCTGAGAGGNYAITYVKAQLTVSPVAVTITAASKSIVYGDADPAFTYSVSGLKNGDTLTTNPTCGVSGAHSSAGTYPITCTGAAASGNYTLSTVNGVLTVATKAGVVTADPKTIAYGQADPTFTYTVSGLKVGDTLTTNPSCTVTGPHANAGTYPIVCTGGSGANYQLSYVAGTLTVTKATATVTADNAGKTYGAADPAFTSKTTGLIGTDTLTAAPTCTVTGPHAAAGTYPITCTGANAGPNYNPVVYVAGTLTVAKATVRITATNAAKVYGNADPAFTSTTAGLIATDQLTTKPVCTVAPAHVDAGTYPITCTGANAGANYTITYTPATLTINKAVTTLTAAGIVIPSLLRPAATLTRPDTGAAISGQTVTFSAGGKTVCTAVTSTRGVAQCASTLLITLKLTATYAATTNYTGSTDTARFF